MKHISSPAENSVSAERAFAELLDRVSANLHDGEPVDFELLANENPDHADRLRQLLPSLRLLANASRSTDSMVGFPADDGLSDQCMAEPLGDFRLIREVGRGGMGIVYEAEQLSLNRRVALKVLPFAATMDPRHLQRFRNEALAAASLRHEHIVHVYGVGCERGVHYYAMELIEGQTLVQCKEVDHDGATDTTRKSEQTKGVSLLFSLSRRGKERFRLIAQLIADAADALEYAHSMGVLHRDIKPGNLMLDNGGHLWITDFGLAKLANPVREPGGDLTLTGDLIGTLRYMSPEAALARHGLVDHRTDVYSLGATLYELLTLRPAVIGEDKQEILKHIAFEEPTPLRKIDKSIPAELETITLKCLAKEPGERYASAKELADDLRRWLGDHAIKAKPPGWREKAAKWGRRHRALVSSGAAVLALVIVMLAAGSWMLWQKEKETQRAREKAVERFEFARDIVGELYSVATEKLLDSDPGMDEVQEAFLHRSLAFYEKFADEYGIDWSLRRDRANAYIRIGVIYNKLAQNENAVVAFGDAIEILTQLLSASPNQIDYQTDLARAHYLLSAATGGDQAIRHAKKAMELREHLAAALPEDRKHVVELARCLNVLGAWHRMAGRVSEAESILRRSISLQEPLVTENSTQGSQNSMADTLYNLASLLYDQGQVQQSRDLVVRAIKLQSSALDDWPRSRGRVDSLAKGYTLLVSVLARLHAPEDAEKAAREAVLLRERLADNFPKIIHYRDSLSMCQRQLTVALTANGRLDEAAVVCSQAIANAQRLLRSTSHPELGHRKKLAAAFNALGGLKQKLGKWAEAIQAYDEAIMIERELVAAAPEDASFQSNLGGSLNDLANNCYKLGNSEEAIRAITEAIDHQRVAFEINSKHPTYRLFLRNHYLNLSRYLANCQQPELRDPIRAAAMAKEVIALDPKTGVGYLALGFALYRSGDLLQAATQFTKADSLFRDKREQGTKAFAWLGLAMTLHGLGDLYHPPFFYVAALQCDSETRNDPSFKQLVAEAAHLLGIQKHDLSEQNKLR